MDLRVSIKTGEFCGFQLKDTTGFSECGYQNELSEEFIKNSFKYTDTVSIVVLRLITTEQENPEYEKPIIIEHDQYDYVNISVGQDGHYLLYYIVLPTLEWYERNSDKYNISYYSDGINIYKTLAGETSEVSSRELVERGTQGTTISRICEDYISICYIKRCFIEACKKIFDLRGFERCGYNGKVDELLIYRRDLLWMAINTISYLVEFGQLDEAERIIELIHNCNGICKSDYRTTVDYGCGCS